MNLDPNMTYDFTILESDLDHVANWFTTHGHYVLSESDTGLVVRGSGGKIDWILRDYFPDLTYTAAIVSKPVGFERGEHVVMRNGIVGTVAWEYGNRSRTSDNASTSVNVHVGSSMWTARSGTVVRIQDLAPDVQAELRRIGDRQAKTWDRQAKTWDRLSDSDAAKVRALLE